MSDLFLLLSTMANIIVNTLISSIKGTICQGKTQGNLHSLTFMDKIPYEHQVPSTFPSKRNRGISVTAYSRIFIFMFILTALTQLTAALTLDVI